MRFGQIRLGASGGVGMCVSLLSLDLKGRAPGSQLSQGRPLRCQLFLHLLWPHPHPSLQHGWCHDDVARGKTHCTVTETSGNIRSQCHLPEVYNQERHFDVDGKQNRSKAFHN